MADDHSFLALSVADKRAYLARFLNYDPNHPDGWPLDIIDWLIDIRVNRGQNEFYIELWRLTSRR